MKKIALYLFFFCICFFANAQCTISPFIQQNYNFDAKLLVLREIQSDVNDPDYDNPTIPQARIDYHLEKLSAIYQNPTNDVNIDSLFNEFQFHVGVKDVLYDKMRFYVDTNVSWVQTLKNTGQTGVTAIDDFLSLYQFTVSDFSDATNGANAGKTLFVITTTLDSVNTYALLDDLSNTALGVLEVQDGINTITENPCNYTGIPYQIPDYDLLVPVYNDVSRCDVLISENGTYHFILNGYCISNAVSQTRYVTVSDDCSQVNFSRTLATEDLELSNVAIYPNPTSDNLYIQGITDIQTIEIYSILGKKIALSLDNSTTVDVSTLKNGVYFLKVIDSQNRSVIRKFIKR